MLNTFTQMTSGLPAAITGMGGDKLPTMSSLEIAELTGKLHTHVLRDIRTMLDGLEITETKFGSSYVDPTGRTLPCYRLPKRETLILVSGYSVALRARIIDRWQELEEAIASEAHKPVMALPDFTNPAAAARAWAEQFEARVLAEQTKALIGSKREATAMNTASQAVKKAEKLEVELDRSKHYATVKRMSALYPFREFDWRRLKAVSKSLGIAPVDVFDSNYGSVKAYHASVWWNAYAVRVQALPG